MAGVGEEVITKVVGYQLSTFNSSPITPNLPQRVAIIGEANTANQGTLDTDPYQITSATKAGERYGYGSPIYHVARICFPVGGGGIGSIPVWVYPQAEAGGATAKVIEIDPTGVATGNGTHTIVIAGRKGIDAQFYNITIAEGDTSDLITAKIEDAVNAVLGAPVIATSDDYTATLTTKWKGATADDLTVTVDTGNSDLGISYAINATASGAGVPSISAALTAMAPVWNTIVVNTYGTNDSIMSALEAYNGIPDPENPTGRFAAVIMKPFIALTGSVVEDPSSITDARKNEVTIAICAAPLSAAFPFEAAANACVLFARKEQDTPELDISGSFYPDMPAPTDIGDMSSLTERDRIVKLGCSTVDLVAGKYKVQDFVTTYHKDGELPPQFRYCRNLMLDFNVAFQYNLMVEVNVVDHVIANDNDVVAALKVIKPKQFKQLVNSLIEILVLRGLLVDAPFTRESLTVTISTVNPDRFNVFFRYKRSGVARIVSTVAEAGFNFGTLTA